MKQTRSSMRNITRRIPLLFVLVLVSHSVRSALAVLAPSASYCTSERPLLETTCPAKHLTNSCSSQSYRPVSVVHSHLKQKLHHCAEDLAVLGTLYPRRRVKAQKKPASMARIYADVNQQMPRAYWDYDSVNISWGVLENYEVVKKIGMLRHIQ